MARYEVVLRNLEVPQGVNNIEYITADYIQYERGDAVFYTMKDFIPGHLANKTRVVGILPRESYTFVREVKPEESEGTITRSWGSPLPHAELPS